MVARKSVPSLLSRAFKDNDHVAAHEESRVSLLGVVERRVVIDLERFVLLVIHQLF